VCVRRHTHTAAMFLPLAAPLGRSPTLAYRGCGLCTTLPATAGLPVPWAPLSIWHPRSSRSAQGEWHRWPRRPHGLTRAGSGQSESYTEKADVYSYGVVVWEMLTKQVPYRGLPSLAVGPFPPRGVGWGPMARSLPEFIRCRSVRGGFRDAAPAYPIALPARHGCDAGALLGARLCAEALVQRGTCCQRVPARPRSTQTDLITSWCAHALPRSSCSS
jgi:hypothetical protein